MKPYETAGSFRLCIFGLLFLFQEATLDKFCILNHAEYFGGSMSFEIKNNSLDFEAKIKILTAWKIGTGPCGTTCGYKDIGKWTNQSRHELLNNNCPTYLGKWIGERSALADLGKGPKEYIPKTTEVTNSILEKVQLLNRGLGWEMEQAEITIHVPVGTDYMDLKFVGDQWVDTSIQQGDHKIHPWFMQTKIKTATRSDTGISNRSPVLQIKPYYRFLLGNVTTVNIMFIDQDNDVVNCEASGIGTSQGIKAVKALSVNTEECKFTLDLSNTQKYKSNDTGIILIDVSDYSRNGIVMHSGTLTTRTGDYGPSAISLSSVPLQLYFEIVDHLEPPVFIDPTPPDRQLFEIYVGAMFSVTVYAAPTNQDTRVIIDQFLFTRRDGIQVNMSAIANRTEMGLRVRSMTMTWIPLQSEIGKHMLCAYVIDTDGNDSPLHCFSITVKKSTPKPVVPLIGIPYFINFPTEEDITCKVDSICRFPIYAKTDNSGGITSILIVDPELKGLHSEGQLEHAPPSISQNVYMMEFAFKEPEKGSKKFCVIAKDRFASNKQCFGIDIQPMKDICPFGQCENLGECTTEEHQPCICKDGYTGVHCEHRPDPCLKHKCYNGGTCYGGFCMCKDGATGKTCENDFTSCDKDSCTDNAICADRGNGNHDCLCSQNSHGTSCTNQTYPFVDCSITPKQHCGACTGNNCNTGDCLLTGMTGANDHTCICPEGKVGSECQTDIDTSTERQTSTAKFVAPTLAPGSVIVCDPLSGGIDPHNSCEFPIFVFWNGGSKPKIEEEHYPPDMKMGSQSRALLRNLVSYPVSGFTNTFTGPIKFDSTNHFPFQLGMHIYCLVIKQDGIITDKRCFSIDIQYKVLKISSNELKGDGRFFEVPTYPDKTKIVCAKNSNCHINVYTNYKSSCLLPVCPRDAPCHFFGPTTLNKNVFIYGKNGSLCHTDIAFNTGGLSAGSQHELCLLASKDGESRCFILMITDSIKDPCLPHNPCLNDGLCTALSDGTHSCICKNEFYGDSCQIGECPASSTNQTKCSHNAYCHTDGTTSTCYCQLGSFGQHCSKETKEKLTTPGHTGAQFVGAALPEVVECHLERPCYIPSVLTGSPTVKPTITTGFVDAGLEFQGVQVEKDNKSSHIYHTVSSVMPKTPGYHKMCIQSSANVQSKPSDEVCYNVHVSSIPPVPVSKKGPQFLPPTLGNGSKIECLRGEPCHLTLWMKNTALDPECPMVESDMKAQDGIYVFQPHTTSPCSRDVSIHTEVEQNIPLCCFQLVALKSNVEGERRCFNIEITNGPLHAKGPCGRSDTCTNGGFCSSRTNPPKCHCLFGYSGTKCEIRHGNSLTGSQTPTGPKTGDLALPKKIVCVLHEECAVPISVTSSTKPDLRPSQVDPGLSTKGSVVKVDPNNNGTYIGHLKVEGTTPGVHKACVQIGTTNQGTSTTSEEICYEVEVKMPDPYHHKPNHFQPHFVPPTLPQDSVTQCIPGMECHILMFLSGGAYPSCPSIKQTQGPSEGLHLFTSASSPSLIGNCTVDVAITTPQGASGKVKFCYNTFLPNVPGETRCFYVRYANYAGPQPSCSGKDCLDNSHCDIIGGLPQCVCGLLQSGAKCQSAGSVGPAHTASPSLMTDFPKPKTVRCEVGKLCQIPVMVNGQTNVNPVVTMTTPGSTSLTTSTPNITKERRYPDGVYKVMLPVTPNTEGEHQVCVKVQTGGDHCFIVQAFTGSSTSPSNIPGNFVAPSMPPDSAVVCEPGHTCHLILYKQQENGQCKPVEGTSVPASAHVVTSMTPDDQNLCETDIVLKPQTGAKAERICVKGGWLNRNSSETCYTINPSMNSTSPCDTEDCHNGVCVETRDGSECKCKIGTMGDHCNQDTKNLLTSNSTTEPGFVDTVKPENLECYKSEPCYLPVVVANRGHQNLKVTDEQTFKSHTLMPIPGTNTSMAVVKFENTGGGGQQRKCLLVIQAGQKDRLCYNIVLKQGPPPNQNGMLKENLETQFWRSCSVDSDYISVKEIFVMLGELISFHSNVENKDPADTYKRVEDVFVFKAEPSSINSGACLTDVAIKPSLSELGQKQICITPHNSSEVRCYELEVTKGDLCKPIICQNGGVCETVDTDEGIAVCVCPPHYSGNRCQHNKDLAVTPFNENEVPNAEKQKGTPKFTGTSLPHTITCVMDQPCSLPFQITDSSGKVPAVSFGHVDPGIVTSPPTVSSTGPNLYQTNVQVTPTNLGKRRVCVQTQNSDKVNMDEICYNIQTIDKAPSSPGSPQFIAPTVGEKSIVICQPAKTCHIPMVYQKSGNTCESVGESSEHTPGVHVFPPNSTSPQSCAVDVGFTPSPNGGGMREICLKPGPNGEKRCIVVKIEETSTVASTPCQTTHCHRGGFCHMESGFQAVCTCRLGSSESRCQNDSSKSLLPGTSPSQQQTFVDTVVPKEVKCFKDEECLIPFVVKGSQQITVGDKDKDVVTKVTTGSKVNSTDGVYQHALSVTSQTEGKKSVCAKTGSTDQICFVVDVIDPPVDTSVAPKFTGVTLGPDSTVDCQTETTCHLLIQTEKTNGKCPDILETPLKTTVSNVHIFPTDSSNCTTDVVFRPLVTDTGEKAICLHLRSGSPGSIEERERCYKVMVANKRDPCVPVYCQNNGECHVTSSVGKCICPAGYSGVKCELQHSKKSTAVDLTVPEISQEKPHFTDLAVPKVINCVQDVPCHVPLKITDPNGAQPAVQFGHVDPGIDTAVPIVHPVNGTKDFTTDIIVTPQSPGDKHVCVQTVTTSGTNVDEICYEVHTSATRPSSKGHPQFTAPTVTDKSTLQCEIGEVCHIPLTYKGTGEKCEQVHEFPSHKAGVFIFQPPVQPNPVDKTCTTDVAYTPASNHETLCFKPGSYGERRCIEVESSQNGMKPSTPCQSLHCINRGVCVTDSNGSPKCVCQIGTSGLRCSQGSQNFVTETHTGMPAFTELVGPQEIICYKGQDCKVPFIVTGQGASIPKVSIDQTDPALSAVLSPTPTKIPNTNSYTSVMTLTPKTNGLKEACIHTQDNTSVNKTDEICFHVSVIDPPPNTAGSTLPKFTGETMIGESLLTCKVDHDCHLPITTTLNKEGKCSSMSVENATIADINPLGLEKVAGSPVSCKTDFVIHPASTELGIQRVCVQINISPSESSRCYQLNITENMQKSTSTSALSTKTTTAVKTTTTTATTPQSTTKTPGTSQPTAQSTKLPTPANTTTLQANAQNVKLQTDAQTTKASTSQSTKTPTAQTANATAAQGTKTTTAQTTKATTAQTTKATAQTTKATTAQTTKATTAQTTKTSTAQTTKATATQTTKIQTAQTTKATATQTTKATTAQTTKATTAQTTKATTAQTTKATPAQTTKATATQTTKIPTAQTTKATATQTTKATNAQTTKATTAQTTKATTAQTTKATATQTTKTSTAQTTKATAIQTTKTSTAQTTKATATQTTKIPTAQTTKATATQTTKIPTAQTTKSTTAQTTIPTTTQAMKKTTTKTTAVQPSVLQTNAQGTKQPSFSQSTKQETTSKSVSSTARSNSSIAFPNQRISHVPSSSSGSLSRLTTGRQSFQRTTAHSTHSTTASYNHPNIPSTHVYPETCFSISVEEARKAAEMGRVSCSCNIGGKMKEIIRTNPKATTKQLLTAAGIGAGSVSGVMLMALLIYLIVSKVKGSSPKQPAHKPQQIIPSKPKGWS